MLEKVKIRSKFYQIGSVALATAIFKSASTRKTSDKPSPVKKKQVLHDIDSLKGHKDNDFHLGQDVKDSDESPSVHGHKSRDAKSGYFMNPPRKKILVRRKPTSHI
jgi:hypothetical protein